MLQKDKIEAIVTKIQKLYLFLTCLGFVLAIYILLGLSAKYGFKDGLKLTSAVIVNFAIFFGLIRRKNWLIPLILVFAAFGFFWELINILQPAESIGSMVRKAIGVFLILFYGYQIKFFSKIEVKSFFGSKGSVIF